MKIPTDIGSAPAIPQVRGASTAPGGALVNLGQAISKAGAAVSRLDDRAQQVVARQQNADNKVWESKAEVELRTRFEEWKQAVGPDFTTESANHVFNTYSDEIIAEAPSNEASNDFTITKNNLWGGHYFPRSVAEEAQIKVNREESDFFDASQQLTELGMNTKDTGEAASLAGSLAAVAYNADSALPGHFKPGMQQEAIDGFWVNHANSRVNSPKDILGFKSDMEGPGGKIIKEMMSPAAYEKLKDRVDGLAKIADKEYEAELARVQQAEQTEINQRQSDNASNLHLAIKEGKVTDASTIHVSYKKLGVSGITLQDRNSLLELLLSENERRRKEGESKVNFRLRHEAGLPIANGDTESLKGMNLAYVDSLNGWRAEGLPEAVIIARTVQITARTSQLPDEVKHNWLEAPARTGDVKLAMPAINLYRKLSENPDTISALSRIDPNSKAMLAMAAQMIDAGKAPDEAVKMATAAAFKLLEQRRDEIRNSSEYTQFGKDASRMATRFIDKNFDSSLIRRQPDTVAGLVADYRILTNAYALMTDGNMKLASDLAEKDLKGTWGVSYVTGTATMMKNPPEALTGGKRQERLIKAFETDLAPLGLKPSEVMLGYDRGSMDKINPTYLLIRTSDMTIVSKGGRNVRWAPPHVGK